MKVLFNIILILLFGINVRAADTLTTKLINSVYLEVVDTNAKYYYLLQSGNNPKFDSYDLRYELNNNTDLKKEVPFEDFIEAIKNDTTKINWQDYSLINAKCVDHKHLPKYSHSIRIYKRLPYNTPDSTIRNLKDQNIIPVLIKNGMSKREIKAEEAKAVKRYEQTPTEEKTYYFFSKPIFSKNHDYVLIGLNRGYDGCLYIFKLIKGNWIKVLTYKCWTS